MSKYKKDTDITPFNKKNKSNTEAVIYTRVSTKAQGKTATFDTQINICQKYAKQKNYKVINTIAETGSAYRPNQQILLENLVDEIEPDTVILVHSYDRFSRNVLTGMERLDILRKKNVFVESATEHVDYTIPNGRHLLTTILSSAQLQSETLGKKVKNSIAERKRLGIYHGRASYGYHYVKHDDKYFLEEEPTQQKVIKIINALRQGSLHIDKINELLYSVVDEKNKVPLKYYNSLGYEIAHIQEKQLTFIEIADILNDYGIKHGKNDWSATNISYLYQKHSGDPTSVMKKLDRLSFVDDVESEPKAKKRKVKIV
jgi:DNA invertase Pin-like site-specific DNA recombinase